MNIEDELFNEIPNKKQQKLIVLKNKNPILYNIIMNKTNFLLLDTKLSTRLIFIKNNITSLPVCKTCKIPHQYLNHKKQISNHCSKECYYKDYELIQKNLSIVDQKEKVLKMKQTNLAKYGYEFQSQRKENKLILQRSKLEKLNPEALELLNNKEWLLTEYNIKKLTASEIAKNLNVYYGTVIDYLKNYKVDIRHFINRSQIEKEIENILLNENLIVESNKKGLLFNKNLEVDIYLPDFKIAIEINGLYWHSTTKSDKESREKHLNKLNGCLNNNIQLMHFTDEQWITKKDICLSIIMNKVKNNHKIFARKCKIKNISFNEYNNFCEENHLAGKCLAKYRYGLFYQNELIQIMSFGKSRFTKTKYEIIRLCSKKYYHVVGGASKLFNKFIKDFNPQTISTYSDRMIGEGNVYKNLGFNFLYNTRPGYMWNDGNISYSRFQFQKHKLKDKLKNYDPTLSEKDNMINNGFRYFWNCGNNYWHWEKREDNKICIN